MWLLELRTKVIAGAMALIFCGSSLAKAPSEEETYQYIQDYLVGCSYVSKVEHANSNFRVYRAHGSIRTYYEFDILDFEMPAEFNPGSVYQCANGACIKVYTATPPSEWHPQPSETLFGLFCSPHSEERIVKAVRYILKLKQPNQLEFPD
ncbi:hypothetical protein [Pseudomonas sp. RL_105y_Pfl2_101]|uniref:hypothetical protein n=1 Tax=Pseudomonas sp. RL_105y_Pfl2_101 TaxID=3088708 RepID=UPI0030D7B568